MIAGGNDASRGGRVIPRHGERDDTTGRHPGGCRPFLHLARESSVPWLETAPSFDSEAEVRAATDADPVIQADAGFSFEIHPMPFGAVRP
jgi:hypothetical protein